MTFGTWLQKADKAATHTLDMNVALGTIVVDDGTLGNVSKRIRQEASIDEDEVIQEGSKMVRENEPSKAIIAGLTHNFRN